MTLFKLVYQFANIYLLTDYQFKNIIWICVKKYDLDLYFPNTRFAEVVQKRQNYCLCIFLFLFTEIIFRVYSNCIKDICSEVDDGFTIIQRKVLNSMCILTIYTASRLHKIFMLHADPYIFGYLFSNFVQSKHDSTCFRITNKHYLQFITEKN